MSEATSPRPGVFLDRDGTLIRDVGYLSRLDQIEILPRVPEALQILQRQELKVLVVTNQSAIARGFLSEDELKRIHVELRRQLSSCGAALDGIYYCPHHPTEGLGPYRLTCDCRKPNGGLARQAAEELNLDLRRSYVVGDQSSDMEMAARIGAKGVLIDTRASHNTEQKSESSSLVVNDLWEAAEWIVADLRRGV